jgi:hypothetical protein
MDESRNTVTEVPLVEIKKKKVMLLEDEEFFY